MLSCEIAVVGAGAAGLYAALTAASTGAPVVLVAATPLAQLRREHKSRLIDRLTQAELPWTGDEGYKKAEVTGGGIALAEIDPRTMESRRHPGLFICGEVLDAFGPIGGYNFLWAWATGRAAGIAAPAPLAARAD